MRLALAARADSATGTGTTENPERMDATSEPTRLRYLGDYELLELLAEGGMGQVFRARQLTLKRELAVKVLHRSYLASPRAVRRFRNEVEVVASLDHPNVLPIYEASEDGGIHFFGMRLAEGGSLAQSLGRGEWRPLEGARELERQRRVVRLVVAVCRAVHHAHQRGVIHRDLKPGNVLLDADGHPLVADFGLAKAIGRDARLSLSHEVLGTPAYMAPEQIDGSENTTVASDVYALGALFYELLANRLPFPAASLDRLFEAIRLSEPAPLMRGPNGVDPDLASICLKCLRKEASSRYETALALAQDLERWERGEPIAARPASAPERLIKWCRRRPLVAGLSASLLLALAVGGLGNLWQSRQVRRSNEARAEALGVLRLDKANTLFRGEDSLEGLGILGRHLRDFPDDSASAIRLVSRLTRKDWLLPLRTLGPVAGPVDSVLWHPEGRHLLLLSYSEDLKSREMSLWNATDGSVVAGSRVIGPPTGNARFSPDGRWLFTVFGNSARIWNGGTLEPAGQPLFPQLPRIGLVWHPDSTRLIAVAGFQVLALDPGSQERLRTFPHPTIPNSAAYSPDGRLLGIGGWDGSVRLWEAGRDEPLPEPVRVGGLVVGFEFNRDGSRLMAVVQQGLGREARQHLTLVTVPEGRVLMTNAPGAQVFGSFSPDGRRLLVTDAGMWASLLDADTGRVIRDLKGYLVQYPQGFSPDGRWLVGARNTLDVMLLDATNGLPVSQPMHVAHQVAATEFSPDGEILAIANDRNEVQLWQRQPGAKPAVELTGTGHFLAVNAEGRLLATSDGGTNGLVLDFGSRQRLGDSVQHTGRVSTATFDSSSRRVAFGTASGEVSVAGLVPAGPATLRFQVKSGILALAFSPDGELLVSLDRARTLNAWRLSDASVVRSNVAVNAGLSRPYDQDAGSIHFHPDGSRFAVTTYNDHATVWSTATLERLAAPKHEGPVLRARYTRDGRYLATVSFDHFGRLWDARSSEPVGPRLQHRQELATLDIRGDDRMLATAGADRVIRIWEIPTGRLLTTAIGHEGIVLEVRFSPEGRRLASYGMDGTVRVWSVPPRLDIDVASAPSDLQLEEVFDGLGKAARGIAWSRDGQRIAVVSANGPVRILATPFTTDPAPVWLSDLASALAGDTEGYSAGPELFRLRQRLSVVAGTGFYEPWVRWFFSDPQRRPASPWIAEAR